MGDANSLDGFEEDEGEGAIAVNTDIESLRRAWMREVSGPELFTYEGTLVEDVLALLENQQDVLESMKEASRTGDDDEEDEGGKGKEPDPDQMFYVFLYEAEVERIRYSLAKYLRTRILKVEKSALHIAEFPEEYESRLSPREKAYASAYVESMEGHFRATVVNEMPERFRSLREAGACQGPDLDRFVACRPNEDMGQFRVGEDASHVIDLEKGDIWFMRYSPIRDAVMEGKIDLI